MKKTLEKWNQKQVLDKNIKTCLQKLLREQNLNFVREQLKTNFPELKWTFTCYSDTLKTKDHY